MESTLETLEITNNLEIFSLNVPITTKALKRIQRMLLSHTMWYLVTIPQLFTLAATRNQLAKFSRLALVSHGYLATIRQRYLATLLTF